MSSSKDGSISLPVLKGMSPNEYLLHVARLVGAIIFYVQEILPADLHLGKTLLNEFYQRFSILYGL